jgi:hypothetical protein
MISHHFRIAIEQPPPDAKNVNAAQDYDREADAEKDAERKNRIAVGVNDGERGKVHLPTVTSNSRPIKALARGKAPASRRKIDSILPGF